MHRPADEAPCLVEGTRLLGEFSGAHSAGRRFLVRRQDGSLLTLTETLARLVELIDGRADTKALASRLSIQLGRTLDPDGVEFLIAQRLGPAGLIKGWEVAAPAPATKSSGRAALPAQAVRPAAFALKHLFSPAWVCLCLASVALVHWTAVRNGAFSRWLPDLQREPILLLALLGIVLASALFHELGHASASAYGGASPGPIGFGHYLCWPAFYSDVTESYLLSRGGRIRTDLGGVYFNLVLCVPLGATFALTGHSIWIGGLVVQHILILQQMLPFVRLDGYWLASDLTGVPDLGRYVPAVLSSWVPGRRRRQQSLGVAVRAGVTLWVALSVVALAWLTSRTAEAFPEVIQRMVSLASAVVSTQGAGEQLILISELLLLGLQLLGLAMVIAATVRLGWRAKDSCATPGVYGEPGDPPLSRGGRSSAAGRRRRR